jgi:hypothetical protein
MIPVVAETQAILMAMQQYKAQYGEYPAGDNRAIAHALCGQNPQKVVFIDFRPEHLSPNGDLLDPWGTPFKIYFSGNEILVRSAGPNKRFDDSGEKDFDDFIRSADR